MPRVIVASPTERVIVRGRGAPLFVQSPVSSSPGLSSQLGESKKKLNYLSDYGEEVPRPRNVSPENVKLTVIIQAVCGFLSVIPGVLVSACQRVSFSPDGSWAKHFKGCAGGGISCKEALIYSVLAGGFVGNSLSSLSCILQFYGRIQRCFIILQPIVQFTGYLTAFLFLLRKNDGSQAKFLNEVAHLGEIYIIITAMAGFFYAWSAQPRIRRQVRIVLQVLTALVCLGVGISVSCYVGLKRNGWEEFLLIQGVFAGVGQGMTAGLSQTGVGRVVRLPLYFLGVVLHFLVSLMLALLCGAYLGRFAYPEVLQDQIPPVRQTLFICLIILSSLCQAIPAVLAADSTTFTTITSVLQIFQTGLPALAVSGGTTQGILAIQIAPVLLGASSLIVAVLFEIRGWPGRDRIRPKDAPGCCG